MKNKFVNKITKTIDFKGFCLFVGYLIQKINELLKDRKLTNRISQQLVDLFAQQPVSQILNYNSITFLRPQIATKESAFLFLHENAETQLIPEMK